MVHERLDRRLEPVDPLVEPGPEETLEKYDIGGLRDVDWIQVYSTPASDLERRSEQLRGHLAPFVCDEGEACGWVTERALGIAVAVAVEDEIEPSARPELDEMERQPGLARNSQKGRHERDAALSLVRLHPLLRHEPAERRGVRFERGAKSSQSPDNAFGAAPVRT